MGEAVHGTCGLPCWCCLEDEWRIGQGSGPPTGLGGLGPAELAAHLH